MSMKRNSARRLFGTAMLAAGVLLFTGCPREIGLGSAVDTQKPAVTISKPEADSVINGTIELSGTATDDLSVNSVTVTFASTSQPSLATKSFPAKIDKATNTWSLSVNTTDAATGLVDSNYEIVVTAADNSNKTSTATRSFQIDNTAPTVLITSPSLYGTAANRTKFCSQLEIKGEAYDASKIQTVKVYLCNAEGNIVAGPLTADGTNTWSAMFTAADLTALQDNTIYYFYAVATDESGNSNTAFYHRADIYTQLPLNASFPSMNDIGHLDQGTTPTASCQLAADKLLAVRIGTGAAGIDAKKNTPSGYPDFTYQTQADAAILWTNLSDDIAQSVIGVNTAVFATIQPPSDNSAILLDTIEIKIRETSSGVWIDQKSLTKQKVGESVNISVSPKETDLSPMTEGSYEVYLKCKTNSNSEISSTKGFQIQSDAPMVKETAVGSGTVSFAQGIRSGNEGSITGLRGEFLRSNGSTIPLSNILEDSFKISCKNSAGEDYNTYQIANGGGVIYIEADGSWSLPIPVGAGGFADDTYTFTIKGTLGEALTMITRVVTVDTTVPVINLISPADNSVITVSENGTGFTFQGNAVDTGSGVATTYWCIDEAGTSHSATDSDIASAQVLADDAVPVKGKWYRFNTPTVFNLSPKLTGYEEKNYTAFAFSKDAAGYVSAVKEVPFFIDNAAPVLSVTEWPALTRQNVDGMTISGKAYDSSGALDKIYVSFDGNDAVMVQDVSSGSHTSANPAVWTFPGSAVINAGSWTDGTHTLAFTAKDKAGRTSAVVTNTFIIDNVAPTVSVANLADGASLTSMDTPVSGTAIDSLSGIKKVTYSIDGGTTWRDANNESGAWSVDLGSIDSEDSMTIRIKAADNAGNEACAPASGDIHFSIDKSNPRASIAVNGSAYSETFMTKDSFSLSGTADDAVATENRPADRVKLTYTKDGGSAVTAFDVNATGSCWDKTAGTWSWTPASGFEEGFYTFTLTVTDTANKVTTATQTIRYDYTAPVLVVTTPAANEPFDRKDIKLSGNVSDSGAGVDKLYYTLDGSEPTTSSDAIIPTGNHWTETKTFEEQGVHTLKIFAVDTLGNKTDTQTVTFSRDDDKPELHELNVTASGLTTNGNFCLAGTAWDTNELDYITVSDGTTTWSSDVARSGNSTKAGVSLTKKKDNPGSAETDWNWSIGFVTGSSNTSADTYIADGNTTFTITAVDVAGKSVTSTRSVNVDTTNPTISGFTAQNSLVKLDESVYDKLTVSASDSGTGLAGVYYKVLATNTAVPDFSETTEDSWESLALGVAGWTGNVDFSTEANKAEGLHYIYVAAKDNAGNRTVKTAPVSVTVDAKKPVITVTGKTDTGASDIQLSISVTDTNPKEDSLSVEVKSPSGSSLGNLTKTGSGPWTVTVPFSSGAYGADGLYEIIVNAKDTADREADPVIHTIRKDTTPPVVSIESPAENMTGTSALFGTSYLFRGSAQDNADGSGVAKILYAFSHSAVAPTDAASYTELSAGDGTWSFTKTLEEGKSAAAGNLSEGKWYLYVLAVDKAGNQTTSAFSREFDIDMKDPVLSVTTPADSSKTTYTKEGSFTISGTASDTNGIAENGSGKKYVSVKVGSSDAVEAEVLSDGTWTASVTRTDANKDSLLSATITVTDLAGKTAVKSVPFFFDTQAPEITITKPVDNEAVSTGSYSLSGTVADTGAGVDASGATYVIKKGSDVVASGSLTVTGASWNADVGSLGTAQGLLDLTVTIKDKLGQPSSKATSFYYDTANPELRVLSISASGLTTKDNFQLAGTAWDTNELDCITVSDGTNTWTSAGVSPTVTLVKKTSDPGSAVENRNWHIDFGVGSSSSGIHIGDGTTTFTITAKDVAGKTVSQTRTVTVDTTAPEIMKAVTTATADVPADKVYLDVSAYKKLSVTATDPDAATGAQGTGLAGVYYKVLASTAADPSFDTDTGWNSLALDSEGNWSSDINFAEMAEGDWKIYAAAKDKAGNRKRYANYVSVTVDAKKPVISITGTEDANATAITLTIKVDDTNPKAPTVSVQDPDGNSLGGLTPAQTVTDHTWEVVVPFNTTAYADDGQYKILVDDTDTRGRSADQVIHIIRKDTTAPAVNTIDAPEEGKEGTDALYGSSYLFRGTAKDIDGSTDCAGLAKVLYAFKRNATPPALTDYTPISMADGSWSVTKSLNEGNSAKTTGNLYEGTWYLFVIAEDKAGNRTAPAVRKFDIDMSSPSLTFTTPADITQTTYTEKSSYTFSGKATDTNGIKTLTVQVDDGDVTPVTVNSTTNEWTYKLSRSDLNKDKPLSAKFVLTDLAGKTTEKTVPLFFDTQAPSVTITLPAVGETTTSNTYSLSGTVADTGAGVAENAAGATYATANATYLIKRNGVEVAKGVLTVTGASWKAENVSLGSAEGTLDLTIIIKDKLGQSASIDRSFYYDTANPEIRELKVTSSGMTTNAGFKLSGTAWDTNELDSISVTDGTTTWTSTGTTPSVYLAKKTADPGEANQNWYINFVAGSTTGVTHINDGTTTFTITAKDVAGKTASVTRTVTLDTTLPVISAVSAQTALVGLDESVYDRLTVTASDPDAATGASGTGLAGVYYQVVGKSSAEPAFDKNSEAAWTSLALGSSSWAGNIDFTGKAEGEYKVYVAAKDNAGNRIKYATPANVTVDAKKPVISITGASDAGAADVNLTVRVTDTNPVAPVIKVLDTVGAEIESPGLDIIAGTTTASYKEWTVTVPFGNAKYNTDGIYKIVVNETDTRGRVAEEATHAIRKDKSAPTASIETPAAGKTGINALYGSSFTFRGSAQDNTGGSGVAKILYAFSRSNNPPAKYDELQASDGTWSFTKDMNAGNAASPEGNLYEGTWYLWILAEDKAGNRSATPVSRSFDIDMSDPVLEITAPAELTQTLYTKESTFTISGEATDTNGVQTLTAQVGESEATPVTVDQTTHTWTYQVIRNDANKDKPLSVKFVLTDLAGKTTEKTVPLFFDTQAPSVTITLPAADETTTSNTYSLSGTVADTGSGVDAANATYLIKKNSVEVAKGVLNVTGASWKAENVALGDSEGSLELTITIKDKVGQPATLTRTFYYDKSLPVITETGVGSSLTTNTSFTFRGTASDTNALKNSGAGAVRITATKDNGTENVIDETIDVSGTAWNKTFTPGSTTGLLADGTYDFTFTVTDAANRTKAATSSVTIDTVAPEVSEEAGKTSFLTDTASNGWFKKEYLGLKATAADNDTGSGIVSVEYAVISNPASEPDDTAWNNGSLVWNTMTKGSSSYTASAQMAGGTNYIRIRATDKAGNIGYGTQEMAQVDLLAPTISGVYTDENCTAVLENSTYLTGKKALALYLKTAESANNGTPALAGSGIESLVATINGNDITATEVTGKAGIYLLSVSADNLDSWLGTEGAHVVSAVISDKAGNSTSVSQLFTIQYDTTAPVVAFTTPSAGATVNKTITVSGTTTEAQGLESVKLYKGDVSAVESPGDSDKLADFTGNDRFNWTYTLNTFDAASSPRTYVATSGSMTLTAVAKDTAGNVTKVPVTFTVDQSADCPEITINNIEFSGMTSSAPKWLIGSKTIYGSVTDDDGTIQKLEYSKNGTDWEEITVNNGSFTQNLDADGTYTLLFRVTDKSNTVFTANDTAELSRPVLKGSDGDSASDNKLYVTVDTTNPNADVPEFSLDGTTWTSDLLNNNTFAQKADTNSFYVRQYVYDENGIDKVEVSIGSGAFNLAEKLLDPSGNQMKKTIGGKEYSAYKYQVTTAQIAATASGSQTLNIRVTDKAGMSKETNATFNVDNDAPTLAVTSHADGDRVKGSFFLAGTTQDAPQFVGATSIAYKVTASETLSGTEDWTTVATNLNTYGAHDVIGGNLSSWRVYFDDDVNNNTDYTHDKLLKKVLVSIPEYAAYLEINDDLKVAYSKNYKDAKNVNHDKGELYKEITTLYIHFKVTDAFGNTSYSFRSLELDPQGDIPSVEITYPGVTGYGWRCSTNSKTYYTKEMLPVAGGLAYDSLDNITKSGYIPETISEINRTNKTITIGSYTYTYFGGETVQGGIVRVQGTAEDEKAIAAVYLQIDPTYSAADGFQWNEGSAGSARLPDGTKTLGGLTGNPYPIETIAPGKTGIKVGTSGAWSFSLNKSGEFNGIDGDKNYVGVRAIAKDVDGNISPVSDVIVLTIDADTPRIGTSEELYLYQYDNTGKVTASQKYTDDMWLKGEWWLVGSVEDSNGIKSITIDGNDAIAAGKTTEKTWNEGTSSETSGYVLKFKIGSSSANSFGSLSYTIYAEDKDQGAAKTVTKTITVNYDNKAPELASTDNTNYRISRTVVQSNGFYTLGSSVTEESDPSDASIRQSGFDRLALYFVRRGATSAQDKLYDTYFLKTTAANPTNNELLLSSMTFEDGLYWKTQEITRNEDFLNTFTLSSADPNIHVGGMVKIGGAMYIITNISGSTVTINGSPAILNASTKKENASFARALIVDHALTESNGNSPGANGYYTDVTNDDGDCMVEVVTSQSTTTFWEANINSHNIPDGSIEIHYVAFDKAGNSASGVVNGTVANNAPRLAGVKYGADNNGDGDITGNELNRDHLFAIASDTGKYRNSDLKTSYVLGTKTVNATTKVITTDDPVMKIKGAIKVIPEIVGGNGALYYSWSVTKNGEAAPYYSVASKAFGSGIIGTDYSGTGAQAEITESAAITLSLEDLLTKSGTAEIADLNKQLFTFTIWDSTEGMSAGVKSQKAVLEMVADVKLKDKAKPSATIKPFYWTGKADNSVYKTTDTDNATTLYGHIDLSADLPTETFTGTGALDRDDKVSGAIVIEGTAHDDTLLSGLYMRIYSSTKNQQETSQFAFNGNQGAYNTTYAKVATYNGGWTGSGDYDTNGWQFEITGNDEFDESGHTTHWKLTLNTEKLNTKAISDLKVSVIATDKGEPSLSGGSLSYTPNTSDAGTTKTTEASLTDFTQFDVVPYITSISTSLDNAYKSNTSVFNRSANGWYPVRRGEEITIKGWNLKSGTTAPTVKLGTATLSVTSSDVNTVVATITDSNASKSGELSITANSIASLNNKHNNALTYNLEKNGINNDTLTDARKLYVWSFNNEISSTSVRYPSFAVGKDENQTVGFIFDVGSQSVYRYTRIGTAKSYDYLDYSWTQWYDTSIAIDARGHLFGSAMNGDSGVDVNSGMSPYNNYANYKLYAFADKIDSTNYNAVTGAYYQGGSSQALECNHSDSGVSAQRIVNPKTVTSGSDTTSVYTVYYDNLENRIVFRYGTATFSDNTQYSTAKITFTWDNSNKQFKTTDNGNYANYYVLINGTYYQLGKREGSKNNYRYSINGYSGESGFSSYVYSSPASVTFAGNIKGRTTSTSAAGAQYIAGTGANGDNAKRGGEYVAVGVVPAGVTGAGTAVVAWTDGRQLWYSYNSAPGTANGANKAWADNTTLIDSDYAGWYVDMDVDAAGGIHIAYYGSSAGDLRYAYIPAYNQASAAEIVTVDSYLSVGTNISITATNEQVGGRYIPYISYYMSAMTKTSFSNRVAWPTALVGGKFADGATNDQYTGNWEVMTVPTAQTPLDYSVGVGVKKNDSNVNKPILGYGTKKGLETAQLQ